MNRTVLTSFTILCLLSAVFLRGLAFNIQPVKASRASSIIDDLLIELTISKRTIIIGESVEINVTVTNVGAVNKTLVPKYGPHVFDIGVFNSTHYWRWSEGKVWTMIVFPPGQTYVEHKEWNFSIYVDGKFVPPAPGIYFVQIYEFPEIHTTIEIVRIVGGVFPILPAPPSPPQPNYTWVDTNETFLYLTYEGINYSAGLAFGLYLPETIKLNEKHSIYIYTTRIFESENITLSLESPLSMKICLGLGLEIPPWWWYMHIGLGFDLLWWGGWDLWMKHIPLSVPPTSKVSLSVSYPNITYSNILEIPLNEWNGPYEVQFTVSGGYVQLEAIIVKIENVSYGLNILTNSLISDFVFSQAMKSISFNVFGDPSISGFCNMTIPKTLLSGPWQVRIDNSSVPFKEIENSTHSSLYFAYNHSIRKIEIIGTHVIPEFPSILILPLLMIFTLVAVVASKKKRDKIK